MFRTSRIYTPPCCRPHQWCHDRGGRGQFPAPALNFTLSEIFFPKKKINLWLKIFHFREFRGKIKLLSTHNLFVANLQLFLEKLQLIAVNCCISRHRFVPPVMTYAIKDNWTVIMRNAMNGDAS